MIRKKATATSGLDAGANAKAPPFDLAAAVRGDGAAGGSSRTGESSGSRFLGSHQARTDGGGRLRVPAAFASLHPRGSWLAVAEADSALLLPRAAASGIAMSVDIRERSQRLLRREVDLGPAWANADVTVVGAVDCIRVLRASNRPSRRRGFRGARPSSPAPLCLLSSTGFANLDDALGGGLHAGEVATLAAHPGQGLSTLAIQVALNVARLGPRVAWIGSHLRPQAVRLRMESALSRVSSISLASGGDLSEAEAKRLRRARAALDRALLLVACGGRTAADLELLLHAVAARGAAIAVVDGIDLPAGHARRVYARLRAVAAATRLAVLVTSRTRKHASPFAPRVEDVRGFAAASTDQSSVVLLYRSASFGADLAPDGGGEESVLLGTQGTGRLLFRKEDGPRFVEPRRRSAFDF